MIDSSPTPPAVLMRGITKRFPGVLANDHIDFEVRQGEIHAILGENGAGKTTLMNILYGIYHPDEGSIEIHGKPVTIHSPHDAIRLGIGMIHQQFRLVQTHTVTENVILGMGKGFIFREREAADKIRELSARYNLKVDPEAYIWQLSAGEQQRVEILKALYRGAQILILDEPTSMLTPGEIEELLKTLHRMTEEGHTILFITHKLDEVTAISHRVTILRQGRVIATLETAQTNERELARLMVGREVLFRLSKEQIQPGEIILQVEDLRALNDKGLPALKGISFAIHRGEIFGVAGVAGNGQRELVETLIGLRPAQGGRIVLQGQDITQDSPLARIQKGLACVPSERFTALVPSMSVAENMILKSYRQPTFGRGMLLERTAVREYANRLIEQYAVITPSCETPVKLLSGGNIQRALLARELSSEPRLLIAATPTAGLDVGATETIWQILLEQRRQGRAILLISEDLEEVMTLSDRVAVMFAGEIMGIVRSEAQNLEKIGLMMAGAFRLPREEWV